MARRKDVDWDCGESGQTATYDQAQLAILMDLRDELKQLNKTLACYRVARMSDDINRIDRRLQKAGVLVNRRRKK